MVSNGKGEWNKKKNWKKAVDKDKSKSKKQKHDQAFNMLLHRVNFEILTFGWTASFFFQIFIKHKW